MEGRNGIGCSLFVNFRKSMDSGRLRSYGVYFAINFTIYFALVLSSIRRYCNFYLYTRVGSVLNFLNLLLSFILSVSVHNSIHVVIFVYDDD